MSETTGINVQQKVMNLEVSRQFDGYSAVKIYVGTDDDGNPIVYQAGDPDGGQVLEIRNPLCQSQQMAEDILERILGYQYQPLTAKGALLDPAAEMGDAVTVNGVYSGIYVRATRFGRLMSADISAPTDEEIEHEFAVETASDRQYTRFVQQTKATLSITATEIRAEMMTKEGGNTSTFGWVLNSTAHTWYSGNTAVMRVDQNGLKVKGTIEAGTSIGDNGSGFTISARAIYNGISQFDGTQEQGVYIGTDGIQLGQNFKVDSLGNITASNMTLKGMLTFYDGNGNIHQIGSGDLYQGAQDGYDWTHTYAPNTTTYKSNYAMTGSSYGHNYNTATQRGQSGPGVFNCGYLWATRFYYKYSNTSGQLYVPKEIKVINQDTGTAQTIHYLGY